jgi:hypothetical protein
MTLACAGVLLETALRQATARFRHGIAAKTAAAERLT